MAKILYIKANPKSDAESRTFQISEEFIKAYQTAHPQDEIIQLDLYQENIGLLSAESVKMHKPASGEHRNHPILKYAYQFAEADKYVIAAPMWNLCIPAILKAYIDYICVAGITFVYTENGAKGLCGGKPAIHITTRGGVYTSGGSASFEYGDRYLRGILEFMGITDVTTVAAEGLDIIGTDVKAKLNQAIQRCHEIAPEF